MHLLLVFLTMSLAPRPAAQRVCDMNQLNREYTKLLAAKRSERSHHHQTVSYDAGVFALAARHNAFLEQHDTLTHSQTVNAELVGSLWGEESNQRDPTKLAALIFKNLDESKAGHSQIQIDPARRYVAVSCTQGYYVVQLRPTPQPR